MEHSETLLKNIITSKKNIKKKIIDLKRNVIDSDNYFHETFKPIIEPLNKIAEKNSSTELTTFNKNLEEDDDDDFTVSAFNNFLKTPLQSRTYDKSYGLHYDTNDDKLKIANFPVTIINDQLNVSNKYFPWTIGLWSLLCEKVPIKANFEDFESYYEILKTTKVHLKSDGKPKTNRSFKWSIVVEPLHERMKKEFKSLRINDLNNLPPLINLQDFDLEQDKLKTKSRKYDENSVPDHLISQSRSLPKFQFNPVSTNVDPELIKFTLPTIRKGEGLYKNVIANTQLVYYDDPNELVSRLNLLVCSESAGNTGVNNEILSILEELRERNLII